MSRVSNRFYVEALEDGSTLHGQLLSTHALSQAWSGTAAVPNWTVAANQPIIYVDLLSGTTKVTPDAGGTWYYNNTEIQWASDSATAVSTDGRFQKVSNYPSGSPTAAIKIIANLAASDNVNTDTITYVGSYTVGGAPVGFSMTTFVRITSISSTGIFGMIEFIGSNIVTEKNQVVRMYGRLYDASGTEISGTAFSTVWKKDGVTLGNGSSATVDGVTYQNYMQISESDITDNSVVECTFTYVTNVDGTQTTLTFKTFENVDDQTDLEQMYIQYNGGNDTSAALKSGQSITWDIWMGTQDSPAVDTSWDTFYVKLLSSDGTVVTDAITGIPQVVSSDPSSPYYGFRQLVWDGSAAHITITYAIVTSATFGRYLTGIVLAEKADSSSSSSSE